jgi:hypothetical protein
MMTLVASGLAWSASPPYLPTPPQVVSTVPSNGDVNPYGVAFVPNGFPGGVLNPGDILVSNFNNSQNLQGTGTTIIRVPIGGAPSLFFQGKAPLGLTTALVTLKAGLVLVGNLPTADGTCATAQPGSILVLDAKGNLLQTLTSSMIDGPWDATVIDQGSRAQLFVSNVLNGTVVRLNLALAPSGVTVGSATQIGSGYMHRCDPAALVVGPTGLVFDPRSNNLLVASTEDNEVFRIPSANSTNHDNGTGAVVYSDDQHLHGPLAMAPAPNGDFLVSNSDVINADPNQPSEIVEFTKGGQFVSQLSVDPNFGGSFGLATNVTGNISHFAAVDDNAANMTIYTLPVLSH